METGIVIKSTGSWYLIHTNQKTTVKARLKGKLRLSDSKSSNPIAVGDKVEFEMEANGEFATIIRPLPRKNLITRSDPHKKAHRQIIAANIDQTLLVTSLVQPRVPLGFIDRFTTMAEAFHVPVILVFNKVDLYDEDAIDKLAEAEDIYQQIGYQVHIISVREQIGLEVLEPILKGKTTLLSGHSGVGKSALINHLIPSLGLKTQSVSDHNEKGQHTTTFAERHALSYDDNSYVIDTPGVKELGIYDIESHEIAQYFPEMRALMSQCKFNNCKHVNEPNCAVKEAVNDGRIAETRFGSYISMLNELESGLTFWQKK